MKTFSLSLSHSKCNTAGANTVKDHHRQSDRQTDTWTDRWTKTKDGRL